MVTPRALPRALVDTLASGELTITGDEHHYLFRVRRLTIGDAIEVADADGRVAVARVRSIAADAAVVVVDAIAAAPGPRLRVTVLQALIKGERMEWCIEKLAEVGADEIVLIDTARAVVRLEGDRAEARRARLESVARAAARQSRQGMPTVVGPMGFVAALAATSAATRLVCHPAAHDRPLAWPSGTPSVAILVGPEGGLTADEVDRAVASGYQPVSLGAGVLRAETAGVVACAHLRLVAASLS